MQTIANLSVTMPLLAILSTNLQLHDLLLIGVGGFFLIVLLQVHGREEHLLPLHMVAGPASSGCPNSGCPAVLTTSVDTVS